MNKYLEFMDDDYCDNCGEHMIELYDVYNNPIGYTNIINHPEKIKDVKKSLSYFKCKKCGEGYGIRWINKNEFPIPFRQYFLLNQWRE